MFRTSLVVQCLRLHTPNAGGPSSIPGKGTRSHMLQLRPDPANKFFFFNERKKKILSLILVDSQWAGVRWQERRPEVPVCGHASAGPLSSGSHICISFVPGNSSQPLSFPGKQENWVFLMNLAKHHSLQAGGCLEWTSILLQWVVMALGGGGWRGGHEGVAWWRRKWRKRQQVIFLMQQPCRSCLLRVKV